MEGYEIDSCLKSMVILYDTREQPNERAVKRYETFGCPAIRQHIDYGDYTFNFKLPNGEWCYEMGDSVSVKPCVSIERKASLTELSGNIIQERERFNEEFGRAAQNSARIYLLVENGNLQKVYSGKYGTKVNPNAYKASMWSIIARNEISGPIFCPEELSGKVIYDILYRELKIRLERGDFDGR